MIKVLIEGHSYKHDLFELIRVFFPGEEIEFINEDDTDTEELLIHSSLLDRADYNLACSKIYKDGNLIKEIIINIDDIHIQGISKSLFMIH